MEGDELMTKETKPVVSFEDSFGKLDIRVGRVIKVEPEIRTHKPPCQSPQVAPMSVRP